jgi:hypothetical protein
MGLLSRLFGRASQAPQRAAVADDLSDQTPDRDWTPGYYPEPRVGPLDPGPDYSQGSRPSRDPGPEYIPEAAKPPEEAWAHEQELYQQKKRDAPDLPSGGKSH